MHRILAVLGSALAVLILGLVALFAAGGSGTAPQTGPPLTLPTTTTTTPGPTTTKIVILKVDGAPRRIAYDVVTEPNVVGLTLGQADQVLGAVGLSADVSTPSVKPGGESRTGTVLTETPTPGSEVQKGTVVQLAVSGY